MRNRTNAIKVLIFYILLQKCDNVEGNRLITRAKKIESLDSPNVEQLRVIQVSSVTMCVSACSSDAECDAITFPTYSRAIIAEHTCKLMKTSSTPSYSIGNEETVYLLDRNIENYKTETTTLEESTTEFTTTKLQSTTTAQNPTTTTHEITTTLPYTTSTTQALRNAVQQEPIKRHHGADIIDDNYILFFDVPSVGIILLAQRNNPRYPMYQKNMPDIFPTFQGQPNAAFNYDGQLYLQNITNGTEGVWRKFTLTMNNDQLGTAIAHEEGISHPQISGVVVYATRIGMDSVLMKFTDGSIKCYHGDDIKCTNCTKKSLLKPASEKCLEIATNLGTDLRYANARSLIGHYNDFLAYTTYDTVHNIMTIHNYED